MQKISIKQWALEDQPRNKLERLGADQLSDSELLAILIGSGLRGYSALDLAQELLRNCNNSLLNMGKLSVKEIKRLGIPGVGQARAVMIRAALELGLRRYQLSVKRKHIRCANDVAEYLRAKLYDKQKEVFLVLYLNSAHRIIETELISEGGITATIADPRIILKKALLHEAVSLVVCHNHPSGSLLPSSADERITQQLLKGCSVIDITLLDHIIVSRDGYYSFANEGKL